MNNFVLRIHQNSTQELDHLKKVIGVIDAKGVYDIIENSNINSNPRLPKTNKITAEILESLDSAPELFMFKSKGLLLSSHNIDELDRGRYRVSFDNPELEGILDGGHNTLAIGLYILQKACPELEEKINDWNDLQRVWNTQKGDLEKFIKKHDEKFFVPVELISPSSEMYDQQFVNHILEISSSRNNNVQLTESAKGNHRGYYKELRKKIDPVIEKKVEWKTGEVGKTIKSPDIVSLTLIPIIALQKGKLLPKSISEINPVSLYSGKGKCITLFNDLISHSQISDLSGTDVKIKNKGFMDALKIMQDIPRIYDYIYQNFPEAFNKHNGAFGRISCVDKYEEGHGRQRPTTKFYKDTTNYRYPDGFIMPIVVSLHTLMKVDESSVSWIMDDPIAFLDKYLKEVVELFVGAIRSQDYNPQSVAKSRHSYDVLEQSFKMALYKEKLL